MQSQSANLETAAAQQRSATPPPPLLESFHPEGHHTIYSLNRLAVASKGSTMLLFLLSDPSVCGTNANGEQQEVGSPTSSLGQEQCATFKETHEKNKMKKPVLGGGSSANNREVGSSFANDNANFSCYVLAVSKSGMLIPVEQNAINPSGELVLGGIPSQAKRSGAVSGESTGLELPPQVAPQVTNVSCLSEAADHYGPFSKYEEHPALFGALLLDKLYLLIATRTEVALTLPNADTLAAAASAANNRMGPPGANSGSSMVSIIENHVAPIFNVTGSKWISVNLPALPTVNAKTKDRNHYKNLLDFSLDQGGYYYCNQLDVATPFPHRPLVMRRVLEDSLDRGGTTSLHATHNGGNLGEEAGAEGVRLGGGAYPGGVMEADWGAYLRKPFLQYGFGGCCAVLQRGFAGGNTPLPVTFSPKAEPGAANTGAKRSTSPPPSSSLFSGSAGGSADEVHDAAGGAAARGSGSTTTSPIPELDGHGKPTSAVEPEAATTGHVWVHLLGRQSKRNPGPRFYSRGLNDAGGAGNDHLYELVMWQVCKEEDQAHAKEGTTVVVGEATSCSTPPKFAIKYTRHTFLRGTIPVHWSNDLKKSIGEVMMSFGTKEEVHKRSSFYLDTVLLRLAATIDFDTSAVPGGKKSAPSESTDSQEAPPTLLQPSLRCLNLLRVHTQSGEQHLTRHFEDTIRQYWEAQQQRLDEENDRRAEEKEHQSHLLRQPTVEHEEGFNQRKFNRLDILHLDWLGTVKAKELDGAVEDVWRSILPFFVTPDEVTCTSATVSSTSCTVDQTQTHFYRVNCADSLDRTNLVCFFSCLQVTLDMLIAHGATIHLPAGHSSQHNVVHAESGGQHHAQLDGGSLLPGDDANFNFASGYDSPTEGNSSTLNSPTAGGRGFFGHTHQHPGHQPNSPTDCPSGRNLSGTRQPYYTDFKVMKHEFPAPMLKTMGEMFVANGDCIAQLYTSSGALHTNAIRNLVPGMKTAKNNTMLSIKRRFENLFEDKKKFRCVETLLGSTRIPLHYPQLQSPYFAHRLEYTAWQNALVLDGITIPVAAEARVDVSGLVDLTIRKTWAAVVAQVAAEGGALLPPPEELVLEIHLARGVALSTTPAHSAHAVTSSATAGSRVSPTSQHQRSPSPQAGGRPSGSTTTPPVSPPLVPTKTAAGTTPTSTPLPPLPRGDTPPQQLDVTRARQSTDIYDDHAPPSGPASAGFAPPSMFDDEPTERKPPQQQQQQQQSKLLSGGTPTPQHHADPNQQQQHEVLEDYYDGHEEEYDQLDEADDDFALLHPLTVSYVAVVTVEGDFNANWSVVQRLLDHCCSQVTSSTGSNGAGGNQAVSGYVPLLQQKSQSAEFNVNQWPCGTATMLIPPTALTVEGGWGVGADPVLEVNVRPYFYRVQPPPLSTQKSVEKNLKSAQKSVLKFGASLKKGFMNAVKPGK